MWLEEYSDDFRDAPMHSSLRLMCLQLRGHPALFPLAKHYETLLKTFQAEGHCWIIYCELSLFLFDVLVSQLLL